MSVANVSTVSTPATTASQTSQTSLNPAAKKVGQDFNALLQAMSASDTSGAQNAFASLLQDLLSQSGATQGHHHHRHHANAAQGGGAPVSVSINVAAGGSLHITA
jgi:hypothetical protein